MNHLSPTISKLNSFFQTKLISLKIWRIIVNPEEWILFQKRSCLVRSRNNCIIAGYFGLVTNLSGWTRRWVEWKNRRDCAEYQSLCSPDPVHTLFRSHSCLSSKRAYFVILQCVFETHVGESEGVRNKFMWMLLTHTILEDSAPDQSDLMAEMSASRKNSGFLSPIQEEEDHHLKSENQVTPVRFPLFLSLLSDVLNCEILKSEQPKLILTEATPLEGSDRRVRSPAVDVTPSSGRQK